MKTKSHEVLHHVRDGLAAAGARQTALEQLQGAVVASRLVGCLPVDQGGVPRSVHADAAQVETLVSGSRVDSLQPLLDLLRRHREKRQARSRSTTDGAASASATLRR